MSNRPKSLLFVFADQFRGMDLACAGNADVHTPNLDALAAGGVRFTSAYANTPVCGPSRSSLLTGRMPTRTGVIGNDLAMRQDLPTFGSIAKANGCRTGYIGKWHLDGPVRDAFVTPERRMGFDHWAAYNCSHDYFNTIYHRDDSEPIREEGYEPEIQTRLACEFIEALDPQDPFCLFLSWGPPHDPYAQVPEKYRERYDAEAIQLRANVDEASDNPLSRNLDCRETTAAYYAAITALDDYFGRLMEVLKASNRAEDTLVVFTSDHGDMLWSHGCMKKQLPYEESISIPLIAACPGLLPAGQVSEALVGVCDYLPTLSNLLGWSFPYSVNCDGCDCSQSWLQPSVASPKASILITDYVCADESAKQGIAPWRGLRTPRYTYAIQAGGLPWLFFDNQKDPLQLRNLVDSDRHETLRQELHSELLVKLEASDDPFLQNPDLIDAFGLKEEWQLREQALKDYWNRRQKVAIK